MTNTKRAFHRPEFVKDKRRINLLKKQQGIYYVDVLERQLKELFVIENNVYVGEKEEIFLKSKKYKLFSSKKENNFVYIYYPWNKTIVKSIGPIDYFKLKTNRNRDLISQKEQEKLYKYKIAVLGMSVGSNIAFVLTQAGISRQIILADFDELDTSNLNRIWAGVHQVGLNKAVIAARRIYEDNPFARVNIYTKGMDVKNLERLLKDRKIDCIIEEIDNMQMKIDTRKLALKYRVPVLMATDNGNWAVLHIERYDLGYKKIFNKDFEYWDRRMVSFSGKKDFADIVINDIVGGSGRVDPKMLASAKKVVEKKLVSWPQLGSSALLGGIAVTVAVKNIVSGKDKRLNRYEHLKILE